MAADRSSATPPRGLVLRLWLSVLVVAALGALLIAEVAGAHLRERQEALRTDRFLHAARDLRIPLEGAVALGLPLAQAPRVQDMLEREQAQAGALSIEVFDPQGRILFGTDRSFLGDLVADGWLEAARAAGAQPWLAEDPDALVVGMPVLNTFGIVVGTVAVRHAKVPVVSAPALLAADRPMLLAAIIGAAVFAAVSFLVLGRLMAGLGGDLAAARQALLHRAEVPAAGPLASAAVAGAATARQTLARMDEALDAARRADADAA